MDAEMEYINREMKSTNKKLDDINEEISTLESDYEIRNTDDYKEKLAEEKLGMTKDKDSEESTDGND